MKLLRAIVTGGATNIGRSISEEFLNAGGRVVVGQPDVSIADSLIKKHGDRVVVLPLDVSDAGQCRSFIHAAVKWLGRVHEFKAVPSSVRQGNCCKKAINQSYESHLYVTISIP